MKFLSILAFLLAAPLAAQEAPLPPAPPVTWHVLLLSSYQYDLHDPDAGPLALRVFDRDHHAWRFGMAALSLSRPAAPLGFGIDLVSGADAPVMSSLGAPDPESIDFAQAFISAKPAFLRGAELRLGKFATTAGYEVIPAWDNINVTHSRSFLFGYAIPFTHTGVRATIPIGGRATLVAGLNRGWDRWKDDNDALSTELALTLSPSARWTLGINAHRGPEQADAPDLIRRLVDVTATYVVSDGVTLGFNADWGAEEVPPIDFVEQDDVRWSGYALYLRTQLSPQVAVGGRVERFADQDGARTGLAQTLSDLDLTVDWTPGPRWTLRGDLRFDRSTEAVFPRGGSAGPADSRATIGFAVVFRR